MTGGYKDGRGGDGHQTDALDLVHGIGGFKAGVWQLEDPLALPDHHHQILPYYDKSFWLSIPPLRHKI